MMADLKTVIISTAREAVESFIKSKKCEALSSETDSFPYLQEPKACFVCLKKNGQLRGCIGTLTPDRPTLAEEIAKNAISAATCDYRFLPVTEEELDSIKYSVDILSPLERTDKSSLDSYKYGVLVKSRSKTGVLLPNLEGVDSVDEQLKIAKTKAGLSEDDEVEIYRFTVERFE